MIIKKFFKSCLVLGAFSFTLGTFSFSSFANTWKNESNHWKLYNTNGEAISSWAFEGNSWYFLDPSTKIMKTSWYKNEKGDWYFFDTTKGTNEGKMLVGWHWIDGYCYYFSTEKGANEGKMLANGTSPDGYRVSANGQWVDEKGNPVFIKDKGLKSLSLITNSFKNASSGTSRVAGGGSGGRISGGSGFSGGSGGSSKGGSSFGGGTNSGSNGSNNASSSSNNTGDSSNNVDSSSKGSSSSDTGSKTNENSNSNGTSTENKNTENKSDKADTTGNNNSSNKEQGSTDNQNSDDKNTDNTSDNKDKDEASTNTDNTNSENTNSSDNTKEDDATKDDSTKNGTGENNTNVDNTDTTTEPSESKSTFNLKVNYTFKEDIIKTEDFELKKGESLSIDRLKIPSSNPDEFKYFIDESFDSSLLSNINEDKTISVPLKKLIFDDRLERDPFTHFIGKKNNILYITLMDFDGNDDMLGDRLIDRVYEVSTTSGITFEKGDSSTPLNWDYVIDEKSTILKVNVSGIEDINDKNLVIKSSRYKDIPFDFSYPEFNVETMREFEDSKSLVLYFKKDFDDIKNFLENCSLSIELGDGSAKTFTRGNKNFQNEFEFIESEEFYEIHINTTSFFDEFYTQIFLSLNGHISTKTYFVPERNVN